MTKPSHESDTDVCRRCGAGLDKDDGYQSLLGFCPSCAHPLAPDADEPTAGQLAEQGAARYARSLIRRQQHEHLDTHEDEWLEAWKQVHRNSESTCVGQTHAGDLGIYFRGLDVLGTRSVEEYGHGNVNVAGGWYIRLCSVEDENGWDRGYIAQLSGLAAFLEAFGAEVPDGAEGELGPFHDYFTPGYSLQLAQHKLLLRMLAALVLVSRAALDSNLEASGRAEKQRAECDAPLAESEGLANG